LVDQATVTKKFSIAVYSSIWAAWSAWSVCINNVRVRVRACNTVRGFSCPGKNMEQTECNSTDEPNAHVKGTDYDVVDPWEEDRKEAIMQLYPDYVQQTSKQTKPPLKTFATRIPTYVKPYSSYSRGKSEEIVTTTESGHFERTDDSEQERSSDEGLLRIPESPFTNVNEVQKEKQKKLIVFPVVSKNNMEPELPTTTETATESAYVVITEIPKTVMTETVETAVVEDKETVTAAPSKMSEFEVTETTEVEHDEAVSTTTEMTVEDAEAALESVQRLLSEEADAAIIDISEDLNVTSPIPPTPLTFTETKINLITTKPLKIVSAQNTGSLSNSGNIYYSPF
uniref:Titin n=1 Tax=Enterobius vermicularis TaxID=51028 RepID=A0A0N4VLC6_ENTVE